MALGVFDPIINAARVGLRKPDPRIFLHALEVLRVPPGAMLFVDDQRRNTRVAEELGIPACVSMALPIWLRRWHAMASHYAATSFNVPFT